MRVDVGEGADVVRRAVVDDALGLLLAGGAADRVGVFDDAVVLGVGGAELVVAGLVAAGLDEPAEVD